MYRPHFTSLVIHDRLLGSFYRMAAVNNTTNTGLHISLQVPAFPFSGYTTKGGSWTHGHSMFSFWRNLRVFVVHLSLCTVMLAIQEYLGPSRGHYHWWERRKAFPPAGDQVVAEQDLWSSFYSCKTQISNYHHGAQGLLPSGPEGHTATMGSGEERSLLLHLSPAFLGFKVGFL